MLSFDASPARVIAATKLAYTHGMQLHGIDAYWQSQPRVTHLPGLSFPLRHYQAEGVAHLEKWDGNALIGDEPGTGKTCTVMAYAYKNNRFPMLVILPKTILLNWRKEITLMLGTQLKILVVGWLPKKKDQQKLESAYPHVSFSKHPLPGFDVTLINYDIVVDKLHELENCKYDYVVLDESHKIKTLQAARTRAILRLVTGTQYHSKPKVPTVKVHDGVKSVTFITGTPMLSRPVELWTTVHTLAAWVPQFKDFFTFAQRYCAAHQNQFGWDFSGSSNLEELHEVLTNTIMIRRCKTDVMSELPAKTYVTVPIDFNRTAYDAVAKAFEGHADWHTGMQTLVDHGGHPAQHSDVIVAINKCREIAALSKKDNAVQWILDYVEQGEKLVVFAHHQVMVDHIHDAVQQAGVGVRRIRGGVDLNSRAQAVEDFQNDPDVKVIVLNMNSAGFGLTLTAAKACAFVQFPWTPAEFDQCSDRVHRLGQTSNVTVYSLVAQDTVEEQIVDLIHAKRQVVDAVIDGK